MPEKKEQNPEDRHLSYIERSPFWGTNVKLIVGISLVAVAAGLLFQFQRILTPLAFAAIISYLLYSVIELLVERTFFSWRGATNVVFLLLIALLLTSLSAMVVALVNQFEELFKIISTFVNDLPALVEDFLSSDPVLLIPLINYEFDLGEYIRTLNIDLLALSEQLLSTIQPVLGQAGSLVTKLATSAFGGLGWTGFVLIVSYLFLSEAKQGREFLVRELEGMSYDIGRMTRELTYVWDAFLRGQLFVFLISSSTMFILMNILGVRYALGLAILAGFARFIPYLGQYISAIVNALVAYFLAEGNYLGIQPVPYMLLVVGLAFLHDQVYDSLVIPRFIGNFLGVHPALVLIAAFIITSWIGVLGLLVAAPVLSSAQLILRYVVRKLMDQDPWPDPETPPPTLGEQLSKVFQSVRNWLKLIPQQVKDFFSSLSKRIKRK
ncbi:MAG: AI-2E family transporter [Anaerolineales bacterium]|nr:AI-2E family transporter [Anaerolineales bacterium]